MLTFFSQLIRGATGPDDLWALQDHDPAPIFHKGNVVMIGDAAHATFPFIGNGAAQAIEDAAVFHALFPYLTAKSQIPAAFAAYNEIRRPRALRVVELSRKAGLMYNYEFGNFWKEDDGIEALQRKWKEIASFTNDADLATQNKMAIKAFQDMTPKETNGI